MALHHLLLLCVTILFVHAGQTKIDRNSIVSRFNPSRNASSLSTPMQVGNGNFAFGTDVTGLQTFQPYAIMSYWGWQNDTYPPGRTLEDILNYKGVQLSNHGRLIQYEYGGVADLQQWLISNPHRNNLGRTGLVFKDTHGNVMNVTEDQVTNKYQKLDLWTGQIRSSFDFEGQSVSVTVYCAQDTDTVGVSLESPLLQQGRLGLFLDFPWNDGTQKFETPFVGSFNNTQNHTTTLKTGSGLSSGVRAEISHRIVNSTFITSVGGSAFQITRDSPNAHRYTISPSSKSNTFSVSVNYGLEGPGNLETFEDVEQSSVNAWEQYWTNGGFVDLVTGSTDIRAVELQRRIILSQYLLRVNEAGTLPPQESGLTNNGWYGKFHMEMFFWHCIHWALWNNWDLLNRSINTYHNFQTTALQRALDEGWDTGARWSKMTDPTGRSAPGEINELLIWQEMHPLVFAEYSYRASPTTETLQKWKDIVKNTADWMVDYAWYNATSKSYDLGPPMYVVSEDTNPNVTFNPAFELSYVKYGFELASQWMQRLGEEVPANWTTVMNNLSPLPVENGTYAVYEGIESDFWYTPTYTNNHPALVGVYGWLPATPGLDIPMAKQTAEMVWQYWNFTNCWGWDFPMLAMSAARNNEPEKAVEWLLHPAFQFDDVGMPLGGTQVPTPYFLGASAMLLAIAMMAEGWDGSKGQAPGFPTANWTVVAESLSKVL